MRKIKDVGLIIKQLKPLLYKYLDECNLIRGTERDNFICPNHSEHEKGTDNKPSCGFIPDSDNQKCHCFSCGLVADIFKVYGIVENKKVDGANFYKAVQELADRYEINYELTELTEDEKNFEKVQSFLNGLINNAHKYLIEKKPEKCMSYINKRGWEKCVEKYKFGYLPDNAMVKKSFMEAYSKNSILKQYISLADVQIVDRLIIPIYSQSGVILGITHRGIDEKDTRQKYMKHHLKNLDKSGTLFNLNNLEFSDKVYLVEGPSSVLTLSARGLNNVVSIMGSSFSSHMYNVLLKHDVKSIVLCFDGDKAGEKCIQRTIEVIQDKSDIKVYIKILPEGMDPDDLVKDKDIETFINIPEMSVFKYQLNKLKVDEENEGLKISLYSMIVSCESSILQERMIKLFLKEMKIQKTTLNSELQKFEQLKTVDKDIHVSDILIEKEFFAVELEKFEERVWRVDRLLGVSSGYSILDEKLDGIQTGLHEVAGIWNVGKSAYILSIALNMLKDLNVHVLYFSIDDPVQTKTLPRMLANLAGMPINTVANPYYKIQNNETLTEEKKEFLAFEREKALERLRDMSSRLAMKDSSHGYDLDYIEKMIKLRRIIAGEKRLVVFVDFLHMISHKSLESTELLTKVCRSFKRWTTLYDIPIITTVESTKDISKTKEMRDGQIKGSVTLQYDADTIFLLSTNFNGGDSRNELFFRDEKGIARPIIKVKISKNKISGFKGELYYKFYSEYSLFQECTEEEMRQYSKEQKMGG